MSDERRIGATICGLARNVATSESREDSKADFLSPEWAKGMFGLATRASGDGGSGGGREAKHMLDLVNPASLRGDVRETNIRVLWCRLRW